MPTRRSLQRGNGADGTLAEALRAALTAASRCALDAVAERAAFAWHAAQHRSFSGLVEFAFLRRSGYQVANASHGVVLGQSVAGFSQSMVTTRLEQASEWSLHFPASRPCPMARVSSGNESGVQKPHASHSLDSQWCG